MFSLYLAIASMLMHPDARPIFPIMTYHSISISDVLQTTRCQAPVWRVTSYELNFLLPLLSLLLLPVFTVLEQSHLTNTQYFTR
jgi:hypothetical protein